ncbi:glycosyltransferase family 2 protein [Trinickia terrae]|uniref:Glycosyltransferase family 2 protein n=1 Tax=Trinickia terrae TaxID=2571161 RepID=A0A4U1IF99_9BURK|nr:glycosyltransferase family 2 protein [Trinickia terrae]TKC92404.1 glycosyltransferase family 2 protein [Trinickia terrae]
MSVTTSVIIPAFHCEKFLPRALESLRNQTYQDFDVIVAADDGFDYLPLAQGMLGDRVRQVFTPKTGSGPAKARHAALSATSAKMVAFLDVDDEYPARRLEVLVPLALEHGAAACNISRIDDATREFVNSSCPPGTPVGGFMKQKHVPWLDGPLVPVVRRDCLPDYPDMWIFEDIFFLTRVIGRIGDAMPVVDDDDVNYRYLIQKNSLSYGADRDEPIKHYYRTILRQAKEDGDLFEGVSQEGRDAFWHSFNLKAQRDDAYRIAKLSEPGLDFQTFSPRFDAAMARLVAAVPARLRAWAP